MRKCTCIVYYIPTDVITHSVCFNLMFGNRNLLQFTVNCIPRNIKLPPATTSHHSPTMPKVVHLY